jgi:signal transduction histidine kinase/integral membrane sensor domain MASE1
MMLNNNMLQGRWSFKYYWRYFTAIGSLSVVYFVTAQLAFSILNLNVGPSPLWPPAGMALAAIVLQGRSVWPGVALGAFFFARSLGVSWVVAGSLGFSSALQAVIGAELLRRMRFHPSLERLQDVMQLVVLGAAVSPLVNASISTLIGCLGGTVALANWQRNLWIFWLGDWIGILVVTPLFLVLSYLIWDFKWSIANIFSWGIFRKGQNRSKSRNLAVIPHPTSPSPHSHRKEIQYGLEAVICFSLLCFISWFVFGSKTGAGIAQYPLEYLAFPFVVWAALRFAQIGAIASSLIVCSFAIWGAARGVGPFMTKAENTYQAILFLHGFMGVITITALVLAAAGSERALAVKLLKEREASLANAQRLAQLGNWDFFEVCQGRYLPQQQLRWSDQLYRLFGFPPKAFEPSWEAFFQVVHPADRQRVGQAIQGALSENKPYSIEYRIVWPDCSERVVSEQSEINRCGITGTVQDITDRQQVETQLREAAERVREAAERHRLLGEMAMRIRRSLNLDQILNTTVAEVRQFLQADRVFIAQIDIVKSNSQTSLRGSVIAESVDPFYPSLRSLIIDDEASLQEWRSVFEQSRIRVIEDTSAIALSPQQARYYTQYHIRSVLAVPILVGDELYGGLVVNQCQESRQWQPWEIDWLTSLATQVAIAIQQAELYRQITELNTHLESQVEERTQELSAKMTELQELNHLKDVFLQAVSHDLRTSLLGMSMVLKNLHQSAGETVTITRSLIERMMTCSDRQLSLINSLLEDHFNEERELDLQCEPLQFNTLIQNLAADYSTKLAQNQATLTYTLPEDIPLIPADPQQLRRVLDNLLINALKHNPLGVNLTLQVTVENQMVRCILQDDGVGMSQQQQKSLFKLYIRGLHTEHLTGIGLGLYQCRQIINAHGGQIGVISTPGTGSTFWFTLPLSSSTVLQLQSASI